MDTLQAIRLGIVQGITEFLPVSSSGHLQIAKKLLGVELEENLSFDVTLHAATVLSTIVVFRHEILRLVQGLFSRRFNEEPAYVLKLILSTLPIGIVGFLFKEQLNAMLESPAILAIVGAMLLLTAALLAFAYYAKPRPQEQISYRDALLIGVAQARAAMPGLARSGASIAPGLLLGTLAGAAVWQTLENGLSIIHAPVGIQRIVIGIIVVFAVLLDVVFRKGLLSRKGSKS